MLELDLIYIGPARPDAGEGKRLQRAQLSFGSPRCSSSMLWRSAASVPGAWLWSLNRFAIAADNLRSLSANTSNFGCPVSCV